MSGQPRGSLKFSLEAYCGRFGQAAHPPACVATVLQKRTEWFSSMLEKAPNPSATRVVTNSLSLFTLRKTPLPAMAREVGAIYDEVGELAGSC